MRDGRDVVIVGGGIAGAALATALARAGCAVTVLEATEQFVDRVRGESMMPWGVAEAEDLGVAEVLRSAGAHTAPSWLRFGEFSAEPREIPVGLLVPGVGGTLNLHHPRACQALLDAAAASGADVRRGVTDLSIDDSGAHTTVAFSRGARAQAVRTRLVVGADGRNSTVRQIAGISLDRNEATAAVVGLLLDGVTGPTDHDVIAEHDHGMCLLLHQGDGRARAYHVVPIGERARYPGASGPATFMDDLLAGPGALADSIRSAVPAGPCAAFPNVETWTDRPAAGAVVLIGDAAGQSDPSVGCGLSSAMRDARSVRDLILAGASSAADFVEHGRRRAEDLRRLRLIAEVVVGTAVSPGPDRARFRARFAEAMGSFDPTVFPLVTGMFTGPETVPDAALDAGLPTVLRAA